MSEIISGTRVLEASDLAHNVARAAAGFRDLGVGPGDAVAILMRNDFAFFEASLAAQAIGAYATPINWHFTTPEIQFVLGDCNARLLVAHQDLLRAPLSDTTPSMPILGVATPPEIATAYGLRDIGAASVIDWDTWLASVSSAPPPPGPPTASMIYTSGTTGTPKGVRRQPASADEMAMQRQTSRHVFGLSPDAPAVALMNGPMYHSAPNAYGLVAARAGAKIVLQARFDAEEMLHLIAQHGVTHMHVVPTMFVRLLKLSATVRDAYDLSSLRFVVHGAAPCPPHVKQAMIEWWGPVINEYYGSTETGITVWHDAAEALHKPGTVGRAIPGAIVKVFGPDAVELPAGHVGDIYMRSAGTADFTYHGHEDQRREVGLQGLVTVGDLGYLDEDGFLFLCDRRRDMIISGGVNIYPAEIEAAILALPGVRDCAVFGIPDDEFGEAVCAHVELDAPGALTAQAVRDQLGASLARYKVPKVIRFDESLPREDSGKIFKRRLREPYWAAAGRNI